jgi:soluble lytic murein transglycosylase-like protein
MATASSGQHHRPPRSRGRSRATLSILTVLVAACASQPAPKPERAHGSLYDSAAEWTQGKPKRSAKASAHPPAQVAVQPRARYEVELAPDEQARARSVQSIVRAAASEHGVSPSLVNGIIWVESKFRSKARGRRGPVGMMQLMPRTARAVARQMGVRYRPYNVKFNIQAGTYYFARMVERFDGDLDLALAAYNIGPGRVRGWLRDNEPIAEVTQRYIEKVFAAAQAFRELGY